MVNPKKIVHLIKDEKITDQIIENFSSVDEGHIFLILKEDDFPLKLVKSQGENIVPFHCQTEDPNHFFEEQPIAAIISHGLFQLQAEVLLKIKKKLPIAWYAWGFDVYGLPKIHPKTYAPQTGKFLLKTKKDLFLAFWIRKNPWLRKFYYKHIARRKDKVSELEAAIAKTDFFVSYIHEDFEIFKRHYPNYNLKFLHCGFSSIDQYLAGEKSLRTREGAKNILVGNSSSPENNHLDIFPILKKLSPNEVQIIVPLNYGYLEAHKKQVLKVGKEMLGGNFQPLLEFMERKNYLSLLQNCSTAIFYHYRQQAMGNILALLYMGARVYLSPKNPLFSYFKRLRIRVFDFNTEFKLYLNTELEEETKLHNRKILDREFSEERIFEQTKKICARLREK